MTYGAKSWEGKLVGGLLRWNRPQPMLLPGRGGEYKNYTVAIFEVEKISFLMMAAAVQERLTLQYYDVSRRSLCIHASCASCEKRKTASSGKFKFD